MIFCSLCSADDFSLSGKSPGGKGHHIRLPSMVCQHTILKPNSPPSSGVAAWAEDDGLGFEFGDRNGTAEQVALRKIDPEPLQAVELLDGLHALGGHLHRQAARQCHDR